MKTKENTINCLKIHKLLIKSKQTKKRRNIDSNETFKLI